MLLAACVQAFGALTLMTCGGHAWTAKFMETCDMYATLHSNSIESNIMESLRRVQVHLSDFLSKLLFPAIDDDDDRVFANQDMPLHLSRSTSASPTGEPLHHRLIRLCHARVCYRSSRCRRTKRLRGNHSHVTCHTLACTSRVKLHWSFTFALVTLPRHSPTTRRLFFLTNSTELLPHAFPLNIVHSRLFQTLPFS